LPIPRLATSALLLAGASQLAAQAWAASYTYSASPRNPYVYAQTSPDILNLVRKVEALGEVCPNGREMIIKVMAPESDYWPLPWYLRRFTQTGWWSEIPPQPFAPVMIVSSRFHAALDANKTHLMVGYFELRPDVFFELYVEAELWRDYLAKNRSVSTR
jgi:predicted membrane-bound mannosyltransferase